MTLDFVIIDSGPVRLRTAVAGAGPLVLMVHGFPEGWYSWRHQIGPVAAAGYRVAAIDVRGYGKSDKPWPIEAYDLESLTADVAAVARTLQPDAPAILIGHDWGAPIVWYTALTRPSEVAAVAGLSVPFTGIPKRPASEVYREAFADRGRFFYQDRFQDVGLAEAEAEADVRRFLRMFYYAVSGDAPASAWPTDKPVGATMLEGMIDPAVLPSWLSEEELDYYTSEFTRGGFRGPMNRYRNSVRDFAWLSGFAGRTVTQPSLFIGGERDPATRLFGLVADPIALMGALMPALRDAVVLEGCGHWVQQERPEEVTRRLIDWLRSL